MLSNDKATVGRKVWYWSADAAVQGLECHDQHIPFDATVVFVDPAGLVTVAGYDHEGNPFTDTGVEVHDPAPEDDMESFDQHDQALESYCTWMPYQKKQHDKQREENGNEG